MNEEFIGKLIYNAALLLSLSLLTNLGSVLFRKNGILAKITYGLIIGLIGIAIMLVPITYAQGILFDGRSILLSVTAIAFGAIPTLIAEAVYQHHERCDGSGYPRGLTSEKILREAHILMVADVVEALMSHRPYRPSLGNDAGIHEIAENRGTLYREDVVDACLTLFKEGYIIDDKTHSIIVPF